MHVREVVVIGEVCAVRAAAEFALRCRLLIDARTTRAVDARPCACEERHVEEPGAMFVRILERKPLSSLIVRAPASGTLRNLRCHQRRDYEAERIRSEPSVHSDVDSEAMTAAAGERSQRAQKMIGSTTGSTTQAILVLAVLYGTVTTWLPSVPHS